jgi:hypothetical protein
VGDYRHYEKHTQTPYTNPHKAILTAAFTGWSMKSTFNQMGVEASSNIDIYSRLEWREYIGKLCTPLSEVL